MSRLQELGRQVAELQDIELARLGAVEQAGEGFIRLVRERQRKRPVPRQFALLGIAAVVGLVLLLLVVGQMAMTGWTSPPPLAVTPSIPVGDTIRAPLDEPIPLRFSDGSEVNLNSGTEAVIRELTAAGARVDITRGSARISVKHRRETKWSLHAGPYAVDVTGTRFDLAWSPERERFSLELWEGSVRVSSDESGHSAVEMVAPERLVIDANGWHLRRAETASAATPEASASAEVVATIPSSSAGPIASSSAKVPEVPARPKGEGWETLAGRGDYKAAYQAAKMRGLGALANSGSASQLIALAETCRLSGHGKEGVAVLSRLRARFPNTEEAALAAFQLGRLTGRAEWFQTYLTERPSGSLALEASGRLMETLDRQGSRAAAQSAARRYLARYPGGPHAAMAVRILDD